jgi:hypothetical protein
MNRHLTLTSLLLTATATLFAGCSQKDAVDEATAAGKTVADFPETRVDLFKGMDRGIALTPEEIAGRNTWMLWTGGNEAFWDYLSRNAYGLVEFLKTIDSRGRPQRFAKMGLINEPGYRQATEPDEFGLYLDQPVSKAPDGTNPAVDGRSTGVIGFRLFPNPNFNDAARKKWDAKRFYTDPAYYQDPTLVRPYRVGMTCALCHVAPHPLNPPENTAEPGWENLSATIGNQYIRSVGLFGPTWKPDNLLYYIADSALPGTVETSIIATDNNNNPNIINSIYNLGARLEIAVEERMAGPAVDFPPGGETRRVPHVLVDGADSIGVAGALDRVYVNIGAFGEEWARDHNPIVGLRTQKPFSITTARKNSVYWRATEERTPNLARYLVRASEPMPLREAPGGQKYLTTDRQLLDRGRIVFAENCMPCHSSKRPDDGIVRRPEDFAAWAHDEKFLAWARAAVMKPDFLENNFLSTDARYPITLLQTNASRALQDNATRGKIWEQFSSENYKQTPSVGAIQVYDPFRKSNYSFTVTGGGPGFYRVPTLVGIWAGAPFLHNNGLGDYNGDPSVDGRMRAFDDAIDRMFWPEKRHGVTTIARTAERSWLVVPAGYLPFAIEGIAGRIVRPFVAAPWLLPLLVLLVAFAVIAFARRRTGTFTRRAFFSLGSVIVLLAAILLPVNFFIAGKMGDFKIGPFPKGMPVNLFASINPSASRRDLLSAVWKMMSAFRRIEREHLSDEAATRVFDAEAGPALLKVSKSPDWVRDRGHYFPAPLPDADKQALKEFLKTF